MRDQGVGDQGLGDQGLEDQGLEDQGLAPSATEEGAKGPIEGHKGPPSPPQELEGWAHSAQNF